MPAPSIFHWGNVFLPGTLRFPGSFHSLSPGLVSTSKLSLKLLLLEAAFSQTILSLWRALFSRSSPSSLLQISLKTLFFFCSVSHDHFPLSLEHRCYSPTQGGRGREGKTGQSWGLLRKVQGLFNWRWYFKQ